MSDKINVKPIRETYLKGNPEHIVYPEDRSWFASMKLDVIEQKNHSVIITTWRKASLGRVLESTIELRVDETVTWTGMELIDTGRMEYLEEAALENLELRRTIHDLGQKYVKLENTIREQETDDQ